METTITLSADVYAEDFEFRGTLRATLDGLYSGSSDNEYIEAVSVLAELIGKDPVKLYALIDVVHGLVTTRSAWARSVAIDLYRFAFSALDMGFLCDDNCGKDDAVKIVVTRIINICSVEIEQNGDWGSPPVTFTLDFVDRAFDAADNLVPSAAVWNVVTRMAVSPYLFFPPNSNVFSEFYLRVVPRLYDAASGTD